MSFLPVDTHALSNYMTDTENNVPRQKNLMKQSDLVQREYTSQNQCYLSNYNYN
jgi:hypothetical protein